jgi:hypothetical protein
VKLSHRYIADRFLPDKVGGSGGGARTEAVRHGLPCRFNPTRPAACRRPPPQPPTPNTAPHPSHPPPKAIDLLDEAGSRVRISAYMARQEGGRGADPRVAEYLQVWGWVGGSTAG